MASQTDGRQDATEYHLPEREGSRALALDTRSREDGDASAAPSQVIAASASAPPAYQLPGNMAVHAENDLHCHIGQELHVDYNYSNVKNRADQIISCKKFVSKHYVSQTGETSGFNNIRDQTKAELIPDQQGFVETRAYQRAVDAIAKEGLVLISGPPGSGKSTTAHAVLRRYEDQGYTPLIFHNMAEWRQHVGNDHRLIVVFQHVFGEVFFNCARFEEGARYFRSMLEFAKSNRCLVVFTAYPHIAQEMKDFDVKDNMFRFIPFVSLFQSVLSIEEKKEMIRRHSFTKDVTEREELCKHIITGDISGCVFPWCLRMFQETTFKPDDSISIFSNPAMSYTSLLSRGLKHKTHGNCLAATLLLLVKASQESENFWDSPQDCLKSFGFKVCKVQCVKTLMRNMQLLFGHLQKPHCSDHQMNMAAAITLASSEFNDTFLRNCDLRFLMEFVGADMLNKRSTNHESFHRRVYDEIMFGHLQQICQLQLLQNEKYLQEFAQFCVEKRLPIHNLFSITDLEHKEPVLYWSAFCPSSVFTVWCVSQMLACGTEEELVSICLQRVLMVTVLNGDDLSSEKVRNIVSEMWKLPVVPVPPKKRILPFPKNVPEFAADCKIMKKHGSYYLHSFLTDGFFPYDGVHVFINEVTGYFRLEMSDFHWNLVLRRVQAGHVIGLYDQDGEGNTFLHLAAKYRNPEAVRFAVRRGASVTARNKDGLSPPDLAAKNEQNLMKRNIHRELQIACRNGNMIQVKKLLCLDATVSCTDDGGNTLLHLACEAGQISIASLLLELGADINVRTHYGLTPLSLAVGFGYRETTDFLLQKGADPSIADVNGNAPLHHATTGNQRYIILLLLNSDADIDVKTKDGDTPLHLACLGGRGRTVRQLIEQNAKLNVKNRTGLTPLHLAVQKGCINIVRLLCLSGANMSVKDRIGLTPVQRASMLKNGAIYAQLLKLKAEGVVDSHAEFSFPSANETSSSAVSSVGGRGTLSPENERPAFSDGAESGSSNTTSFTQHESRPGQSSVEDIGVMFPEDSLGIRSHILLDKNAVKLDQGKADKRNNLQRSIEFCSCVRWFKLVFGVLLILCMPHGSD